MRFDFGSFLIGFAAAAIIGFALYRFRPQLVNMRTGAGARSNSLRRFLSNSAETRYFQEILKVAERYHIAGDKFPLSQVFIEPRFIPLIKPIDLEETETFGSVYHVVPQVHDLPAIYSTYNVNTLSVHDLQTGERHLALLGVPGMGRSTALAIIALFARKAITVESLDSMAGQVLVEEEENLDDAERAARIKLRAEQQNRALKQLRQNQSNQDARDEKAGRAHERVDFTRLMPILVHVRDIDLAPESYGVKADGQTRPLDPAEPLVRAILRRFSVVAANTVPRVVYYRLTMGTCLILLDGFDELSPAQLAEKLTWLEQFKALYGANFIITAGAIEGYDPLVNLGFTPLIIRPWSETEFDQVIARWATAWSNPLDARGKRLRTPPAPIDEAVLKRVRHNNRARTPLDVTLKTWAAFEVGEEAERRGAYGYFVRTHLSDPEKQLPLLTAIAAGSLDEGGGSISRERIKAIIAPMLVTDAGKPRADADEFLGRLLNQNAVLGDAAAGQYLFRHPVIAGFLAAESLIEASSERIAAVGMLATWTLAMPFAAAFVPLDSAIFARLNAPPDLIYSNLFEVARWLPDAPTDARWRGDVLRRLSAGLIAPTQFLALRERALAALVTSRDPNVRTVLQQTLRATDPTVRRLAAIGLGVLGDPEVIKDLEPLFRDRDPDVQIAAGLALSAIKSDGALERVRDGLFNGDEGLRRAIAEALAAIPDYGHPILREAMESSDPSVRRATAYGLGRITAPWALAILYRTFIEDSQWIVRSAAQQEFDRAESPEGTAPLAHPDADALTWLIEWAATKGQGVPQGEAAREVLVDALQAGDPLYRATAALTMAYLGYVPGLKPLYGALRDSDENVRGTVYEALAALQVRLGSPLPAV